MARNFRPSAPFTVPMKILQPAESMVYGARKNVYPDPAEGILFYGSFRTFGGTENIENGIYTIVNTAVIDTWYSPDITADCRIYLCETGEFYDVVSDPEDIDFRHQFLQFKVKKVGGKA